MRKNIALVTGAAGFLGSHLVDRLLDESYEVVGIDNLMTGTPLNLTKALENPHFHFQIQDVREPIPVYADIVFNLACPASPVHYQSDPYATFTTSVLGVKQLVELARQRPSTTIIQASTSEVYGDPDVHPQSEEYWGRVNPIGERACYDEGKRAAETLLSDAARAWGVDARIVRIFNTYGPRMALDDGRVVSNFVIQALRNEPITIFGDGSQTRSFCYVDDLVNGLIQASRIKSSGPVNLGNPEEVTMIELAKLVVELSDSQSVLEGRPLPADDPKRRCPDISKAKKLFGFEPSVPLRDGLSRTIDDFRLRLR